MMRMPSGRPIAGLIPDDVCQPPVDAFALADRLSDREVRKMLDTVIVWAPEVFELALRRLGARRSGGDVR